MGFIDVSDLSYSIGGHLLFHDVSFRVGEGSKVALVGANGTGKTTLLRLIAGDIKTETGTIRSSGGVGVMRQFIGSGGGEPRCAISCSDWRRNPSASRARRWTT